MDAVSEAATAAAGMSGGILEQIREGRGSTAPDRRGSTDPEHHARQIAFKLAVLSNPRLKATNPSSTLKSLTNLMVGSADNKARVVAGGGVEGAIKALQTFPNDAEGVVYWAICVLDQVSQGGPAALARLQALGAATHVRAAMEVPGLEDDPKEWGQEILAKLAFFDEQQEKRAIAFAMASHARLGQESSWSGLRLEADVCSMIMNWSALAEGWKEYKQDGKPYYHHAATNTSQWERPTAFKV